MQSGHTPSESSVHTERVKEHVDLTTVTLLIQDQPDGLEIWDRVAAQWVPVDNGASCGAGSLAVLVNAGRFLELWTAGRFPATPHRVRAVHAAHRISTVCFVFPDWDAPIAPLPSCRHLAADPDGAATVAGHEMPCAF
eukprot:TRINITY_DN762_c0_g1_i1.p3 TRINITY_DN762_c0_g1~~TRINITY_DN762_c0_g1_i1.p3  ORF type:complete len:138 (+),score=33.67 TRINITY_DN762_c0_g1_i1:661-1074(+)